MVALSGASCAHLASPALGGTAEPPDAAALLLSADCANCAGTLSEYVAGVIDSAADAKERSRVKRKSGEEDEEAEGEAAVRFITLLASLHEATLDISTVSSNDGSSMDSSG